MTDHPDLFNVRKLVLILATGPLLFLLLVSVIDVSWHRLRVWQADGVWCTQTSLHETIKLYGRACQK